MMTKELLKEFICEVLSGFGNKSLGKNGGSGNILRYGVGVKSSTNVLDDEENDEQVANQDTPQAACCLILKDDGSGKVLAVSRKDNPLLFGFPGGHVDPGERPIDAAARELEEECGLIATDLHLVFSCEDAQGFVTSTYACEVEGEIHTDEKGVIKWVDPSVLMNPSSSPFVDYNTKLFRKLNLTK